MTKLAAITAAITLTVVFLTGAAAQVFVNAVLTGHSAPSGTATADIPPDYLTLYQHAAAHCPGLDWAILASVGKVESDHGRSTLPGVAAGTENHAGAGGSMQFLQASFDNVVARHEIPPGGAHPPSRYNPHDAVHAAAFYICDALGPNGDIRRALFAYNHSDDYVEAVLAQADTYRAAPEAHPGNLRLTWPPEQATMPDPTTGGRITPRTYALVHALRENNLTGNGIACFGHRPNPTSDHPKGRACDIFFDPNDPESVAEGWRVANWLITHQAQLGIKYIVWDDLYWSAADPRWVTYHSDVYGCPNSSPIADTSCHRDHAHASLY